VKPSPASGEGRAYAREIERVWSDLQGRPVVLSPKDWTLITEWHARGVPLSLIHDAVAAVRENSREPPRGLAYLAPAVEEAFSLVLDGRRRAAPAAAPPREPPIASWRRFEREAEDSPAARLVRELLAALDAGEDPVALDGRLDRELPGVVGAAVRDEITSVVEAELAPFAERMAPAVLDETVRSAVVFRLRRRLGLPGLVQG